MAQPAGESGSSGTATPPGGSTPPQNQAAAPAPTPGQPNTTESKTFDQAELDRIVGERLAREREKYSDYEQLQQRAQQWDKFVAESKSDQEKALDAARTEFGGQLVAAHLKAAAAGRLGEGAQTALLAGVDKGLFLTKDGTVDEAKVSQFIDSIAPAPAPQNPGMVPGGFGQGDRSGQPRAGIESGAEAYRQRHAKETAAPLFT